MKQILLTIVIIQSLSCLAFAQGKIAYSHMTDGYWQIWVMDDDGSNKRQVTTSDSDKRTPMWLNKNQQIMFRDHNGRLYTINLNGTNEKRVLENLKNINNPFYCPSTNKIVFVSFGDFSSDISEIWLSDLEGKNPKLLTKDKHLKYQPAVSLDGKWVVYVKINREKNSHDLWLYDVEKNENRQLIYFGGRQSSPAFSRDAKEIIFSSNHRQGNYEVYKLGITSNQLTPLTNNPDLDIYPRYSPDNSKIVFVSNRNGNQQIWTMDSDGNDLKELTNDDIESIDPVFSLGE
jgi:TolB protein